MLVPAVVWFCLRLLASADVFMMTNSTSTLSLIFDHIGNEPFLYDELNAFVNDVRPDYKLVVYMTTDQPMKDDVWSYLSVEQGPEVLQQYSGGDGTRNLIAENKLLDLYQVFLDYDLYDQIDAGWLKGASNATNGHPFVVPISFSYWGMFYRKSVFRRYNLSPPHTWDEWMLCCEVLRRAGLRPIEMGNAALWPGVTWFDYFHMRINGPAAHQALLEGKTAWTDPSVVNTFREWIRIIDLGYASRNDIRNGGDVPDGVFQGTHGMGYAGGWVQYNAWALVDDLDYFPFPIYDTSLPVGENAPADGIAISARVRNRKAAMEVVGWLASKEASMRRTSAPFNPWGLPCNRYAKGNISNPLDQKALGILNRADHVFQVFDRDTPPEIFNLAYRVFQGILLDPLGADGIVPWLGQMEIMRQQVHFNVSNPPTVHASDTVGNGPVVVNLTTATQGATIYFTLDGSKPDDSSEPYTGPFTISTSGRVVLRAVTIRAGLKVSAIAEQVFDLRIGPQPTLVTVGSGIATTCILLSTAAIAIVVATMVAVWQYRREPIVKASSAPFNMLMMGGAVLALTTGIWMSFDVSLGMSLVVLDRSCMVQVWAISVGWAICFGALFAKTYRVMRLFDQIGDNRLQIKVMSSGDLAKIVACVAAVEALICAAWQVLDPLRIQAVALTDQTYAYMCRSQSTSAWIAISCVPKIVLSVIGVYQSIRTRNVADAFNESKRIAFAMYNTAFIGAGAFSIALGIQQASMAAIIREAGLLVTTLTTVISVVWYNFYVIVYRPDLNDTTNWNLKAANNRSSGGRPPVNPPLPQQQQQQQQVDGTGSTRINEVTLKRTTVARAAMS
ncbi:unnamed protein product (mitochondrion) [Plasmodiophora brassicae]|uniref:G-protein coupled receptors family 3 profile domain-containing protein n=1 Tax=Plasmodiophora brassicae TaxID=37360 RepID=A0A3P3YJZ7_PLABS|nr:unnamed protein product [Plasmodiophora brassicae]